MLKEDLKSMQENIKNEIDDSSNPAKTVKQTLAYKMLTFAYNLAKWWTGIAVIALIAQITLKILENKLSIADSNIPGLGILFMVSGAIVAAVAGGEKITEGIAKLRNGHQGSK